MQRKRREKTENAQMQKSFTIQWACRRSRKWMNLCQQGHSCVYADKSLLLKERGTSNHVAAFASPLCSPYFKPWLTRNKYITAPPWPKQDPWNSSHIYPVGNIVSCQYNSLSLAHKQTQALMHAHKQYSIASVGLSNLASYFLKPY